jgi:TonB family protein
MKAWLRTLLLLLFFAVAHGSADAQTLVHAEFPKYPPLARSARIEGQVRVKLTIGTDGKVVSANAISGPKMLHKSVEESASKWIYAASSAEGATEIKFNFQLGGEPVASACATISFDPPARVQVRSNPPQVNTVTDKARVPPKKN